MSFQTFRKHTSSRQNERIKTLLARLEKFESEQNPVENESLFALGFTDRSRITYHDNLSFTRLSAIVEEDTTKVPEEPNGTDFNLWYSFDGLTELYDHSYFGHVGELFGTTGCGKLIEGVDEGMGAGGTIAMKFDGIADYVKTLTSPYIQITGKTVWSIFMRFKVNNSSTPQVLFEKLDDVSANYAYKGIVNSGRMLFVISRGGVDYISVTSGGAIQNNTWYDAWFTFDYNGGTPNINMYLNNVLHGTNTGTGGFSKQGFSDAGFDTGFDLLAFKNITGTATSLIIGANTDLTAFFGGYIQDFRFWNRLINATDVGRMWINKISISNIPYEDVAVVGFSCLAGPKRRLIQETWTIADQSTPTYLPTNPKIRNIAETLEFSDAIDPETNPVIPRVVGENIVFTDAISVSKSKVMIKVGSISKSTNTSGLPKVISHSEEVGFTPKFILFWGNYNASYNLFEGENTFFMGFTDGTNNRSTSFSLDDDEDTTQCAKGFYDSAILEIKFDNSLKVRATCSFTTNGFDLRYVNNNTDPHLIHYIAFGGTSLTNAKVGHFAQPTAINASFGVTGVGFQPDTLFLLPTTFTAINGNNTDAAIRFGFGCSPTERFSYGFGDDHGVGTTDNYRIGRSDRIVTLSAAAGGAILKSADLVSMGADGFTLNYDVSDATAYLCAYAALKGVRCKVGKFTPTNGTGLQVVTGTGFLPSLIIFMGHGKALETDNTASAGLKIGVGAVTDSLNRRSVVTDALDNEDVSVVVDRAQSSKCFQMITAADDADDSIVTFEMDLVSMDSNGFTVNKTKNTNVAQEISYIAIA